MRPFNPQKRPLHPWAWLATIEDLRKGLPLMATDFRDHKALANSKGYIGVAEDGSIVQGSFHVEMLGGIWYVKRADGSTPQHSEFEFRVLP